MSYDLFLQTFILKFTKNIASFEYRVNDTTTKYYTPNIANSKSQNNMNTWKNIAFLTHVWLMMMIFHIVFFKVFYQIK